MTEAQWLACDDPGPMLEFLRGKASDRKLRLFAVACCRRIWPLLTDERSRRAVEVAERYADTAITSADLKGAAGDAWEVTHMTLNAAYYASMAAYYTVNNADSPDADDVADAIVRSTYLDPDDPEMEDLAHCHLLRDILPNPFRLPPVIDAAVLAWNHGAVVQLAQDIYEGRSFDRITELGGMLEQAGCKDQDILGHCREQGQVHVRGCWLVDRLLGKE